MARIDRVAGSGEGVALLLIRRLRRLRMGFYFYFPQGFHPTVILIVTLVVVKLKKSVSAKSKVVIASVIYEGVDRCQSAWHGHEFEIPCSVTIVHFRALLTFENTRTKPAFFIS